MLAAPLPANELSRLETLKSLNVLDSEAEERFDRITRLAQRLFKVETCLVSLIDSDRQWFKSAQGLDACQTARDISFCGHAIVNANIFMVEDTLLDERFVDNPLVLEAPFIRFYAGYPLAMKNGIRVGTLCLIDSKPRTLTHEEALSLEDLGKLVEDELQTLQRSTTDVLTGIANRRGFQIIASRVLVNNDRLKINTCLLFFDLDFFKEINDQFGHDEGDNALCMFSDLLMQGFRESDVVARFGGDEFVVLMSYSDQIDIDRILERFKSSVVECNSGTSRPYQLAYSVGAAYREAASTLSLIDLLADADKAMFIVKARHHKENKSN